MDDDRAPVGQGGQQPPSGKRKGRRQPRPIGAGPACNGGAGRSAALTLRVPGWPGHPAPAVATGNTPPAAPRPLGGTGARACAPASGPRRAAPGPAPGMPRGSPPHAMPDPGPPDRAQTRRRPHHQHPAILRSRHRHPPHPTSTAPPAIRPRSSPAPGNHGEQGEREGEEGGGGTVGMPPAGALRLRDGPGPPATARSSGRVRERPSRPPSTRASRADAAPGVQIVRTVARSIWTPGAASAPQECGPKADGMGERGRVGKAGEFISPIQPTGVVGGRG